jgi:hypothetical protein
VPKSKIKFFYDFFCGTNDKKACCQENNIRIYVFELILIKHKIANVNQNKQHNFMAENARKHRGHGFFFAILFLLKSKGNPDHSGINMVLLIY